MVADKINTGKRAPQVVSCFSILKSEMGAHGAVVKASGVAV